MKILHALSGMILLSVLAFPALAQSTSPLPVTTEAMKLQPLETADLFGSAVAFDGNTMVVGATGADGARPSTGAAFVFQQQNGAWVQTAKLFAADGQPQDTFAEDNVAISGNTIVIGAPGSGTGFAGASYVFERVNGNGWVQTAKLVPSDSQPGGRFGFSVAISNDTILVGAPTALVNAGEAYIFRRANGSWRQQAKLQATDSAAGSLFGISVGMSSDTAVIGASHANVTESVSGAAYIFRPSNGIWRQQAELEPVDNSLSQEFGGSVAIAGGTILVGSIFASSSESSFSGAVYVFDASGSTFRQTAKLFAPDGLPGDSFGRAIAFDGNTAVVGQFNDRAFANAGAGYVFRRHGDFWRFEAKVQGSDTEVGDDFGCYFAVNGDLILGGAEDAGEDTNPVPGEAYLFQIKN